MLQVNSKTPERRQWRLTISNLSKFTCSKLTIETLEQGVKDSATFIVNFEHIFVPVFLLSTLSR